MRLHQVTRLDSMSHHQVTRLNEKKFIKKLDFKKNLRAKTRIELMGKEKNSTRWILKKNSTR